MAEQQQKHGGVWGFVDRENMNQIKQLTIQQIPNAIHVNLKIRNLWERKKIDKNWTDE